MKYSVNIILCLLSPIIATIVCTILGVLRLPLLYDFKTFFIATVISINVSSILDFTFKLVEYIKKS